MSELDDALKKYNSLFKKPIVATASDFKYAEIDRISFGDLALDIETGGGVPRGKVTMIVGNESTGKTTLTMHLIKQAQKLPGNVLFIDVEGTFDPAWAKTIGIDLDRLKLAVPDVGEQAVDILELATRSNECSLIILDSIAAMMPAAEISKPMVKMKQDGDYEAVAEQIGDRATMLNRGVRRLTSALNEITELGERNSTAIVLLNQFREKIGVMNANNEVIPGGRGIKFVSSMIMELRRPVSDGWMVVEREGREDEKDSTVQDKIGQHIRFRTLKNKTYVPFRSGTSYLYFDGPRKGQLDVEREVYVYSRLLGLLNETGKAVFKIDGKVLRGEDQVINYLMENPRSMKDLETQIRARYLKK